MTEQNKKPNNTVRDEFERIEDEIIRDRIREGLRKSPNNNPMEALEEIGFTWYDDDYPSEEDEENAAVPENRNQEDLVAFFKSNEEPSDFIFEIFSAEKASDTPNLPLFRKYFREANQNLKAIILWGLERYPNRIDLLHDLSLFHDFSNILSTVIKYYIKACKNQENIDTFNYLAQEFYYTTLPDGYDAYYALKDLFPAGSAKRTIIDFLISEEDNEDRYFGKDFH